MNKLYRGLVILIIILIIIPISFFLPFYKYIETSTFRDRIEKDFTLWDIFEESSEFNDVQMILITFFILIALLYLLIAFYIHFRIKFINTNKEKWKQISGQLGITNIVCTFAIIIIYRLFLAKSLFITVGNEFRSNLTVPTGYSEYNDGIYIAIGGKIFLLLLIILLVGILISSPKFYELIKKQTNPDMRQKEK